MNKNWIGISFIILALSVSFYLLKIAPDTQKDKMLQSSISQCKNEGQKVYEADVKLEKDRNSGFNVFTPEYKFDDETRICYYKGGYSDTATEVLFIKDVYTNKTLVSFVHTKGSFETDNETQRKEYEDLRTKIFGAY